MNPFDIVMIVALGIIILYSLIRGIIHVAVSLLSFVIGIWIAFRFYPVTARFIGELLDSQMWSNILGFLLIFFLVGISVTIAGKFLKKMLTISSLGWIDRVGGALFGFVMGSALIGAIVMMIVAFAPPKAPFLQTSQLVPHVVNLSGIIIDYVPSDFEEKFSEKGNELKVFWEGKIGEELDKPADEEGAEEMDNNAESISNDE